MNLFRISFFFLIMAPFSSFSQEFQDSLKRPLPISHSAKGFEFRDTEGKFLLQIAGRLQFRFASPDDQNPVTFDDFTNQNTKLFKINRARLKVGGHAYQPWLKYYFEYELGQSNLLDFRIMVEKWPWLNFKFGQWKVEYTRERFISSGEQQMVDRSLINRAFTLDRQQGITLYGNLDGGGLANFDYWVAVLTGAGRGATSNDDSKLMYFGRLQWNFLGRPLPFEGGDLELSQMASGIVAVAAATNTSPYTRFSQAGGGSLEGFEEGLPGQYTVNQYQLETAFNYQGFSWASEFHRKFILDNITKQNTSLGGYYLQAGYFLGQVFTFWPQPLEVAARIAQYRPNLEMPNNLETELALAFNYFFEGHKNKITVELTRFTFEDETLMRRDETRIRVQYDISF
ncbi:OprO/OprP family phosphate-selective porin [Algoriphagus confluentis]|uniref:Porin n=1 Tax=Algoriphagus confluentis TaxID=1697556 RepID=A0ABQ6PJH7_9BACT|nr:hypothetical protein Aconfl_07470 [Algoriphagus confluentis]